MNINPLKPKFNLNSIKKLHPTWKKVNHIITTKTNQLMLFREMIIVYFENHMKHMHATEWKRWIVLTVTAGGSYGHHHALWDET